MRRLLCYALAVLVMLAAVAPGHGAKKAHPADPDDPADPSAEAAEAVVPRAAKKGPPASSSRTSSSSSSGVNLKVPLSRHPDCRADVRASDCPKEVYDNNVALLQCLQSGGGDGDDAVIQISEACDHTLWQYKVAITQAKLFFKTVQQNCTEDLPQLQECVELFEREKASPATPTSHASGHALSCAIAKKSDPEVRLHKKCGNLINQIEQVVFSDYRLIGDFVQKCGQNIDRLQCGTVKETGAKAKHSQGKVIECLSEHVGDLDDPCKREIFKLAELQSEDVRLDRAFYVACLPEKKRFCKGSSFGQGQVFSCLMKHKMHPEMSLKCKNQITRRQKLIAQDFQVSRGLLKGCFKVMRKHQCRLRDSERSSISDHVLTRLSSILLCLEDVVRTESPDAIGGQCLAEMKDHRKMLMEDWRISPEIVLFCKDDIETSCFDKGPNGQTLHCLMGLASKHQLQDRKCESVLQTLLREADVVSNWKVDPVLQKTCQDVVNAACDPNGSNEDVMSCLLTNAAKNSRFMTNECKKTLMHLQYFMARDFTLTPKLYRKCRREAVDLCDAEDDWNAKANQDTASARMVFPCLVRNLYNVDDDDDADADADDDLQALSADCADQVELALEQRAISVKLHPEIEDSCRDQLVELCAEQTEPGAEIRCLQDNIEDLDEECHAAVTEYSKIEAKNTWLNPFVTKYCTDVIKRKCTNEFRHRDAGKIMHCLIEYKVEHRHRETKLMDEKCLTAVEHWQIFTLNDWTISQSFKDGCKKDVRKLCQPKPKTKSEALRCLTSTVENNLLNDEEHEVSEKCRSELKFQLLQQHSNIKLDPVLRHSCQSELNTLCQADRSLECLKSQRHSDLSSQCRKVVFRQERAEVLINKADARLMDKCSAEVKKHCQAAQGPNAILNCLKENMEEVNFDTACKRLVTRRIVQQMKDYRLNPRLQKACKADLPRFCSDVIYAQELDENDFLEGAVINCLKDKFNEGGKDLSKSCKSEVENILRQATVDIRAHPQIEASCPLTIAYCKMQVKYNPKTQEDGGKIEECLKTLFQDKQLASFGDPPACSRHVAKLIETESLDIQVDRPLLDACSLDLAKFCRGVPVGEGRQISCLRQAGQTSNLKLERECEKVLNNRLELYRSAVKVVPLQSVSQLYEQVSSSPHRNYFILVTMAMLVGIFLVGACCGRTTRRMRKEMQLKVK